MVIINILLAFFKHFSEMFQHFQKCSNIFQKCWFHQLFVEHFCKNVAIFFLEMMEHFLKKHQRAGQPTAQQRARGAGRAAAAVVVMVGRGGARRTRPWRAWWSLARSHGQRREELARP
jgi:hypothetical protein